MMLHDVMEEYHAARAALTNAKDNIDNCCKQIMWIRDGVYDTSYLYGYVCFKIIERKACGGGLEEYIQIYAETEGKVEAVATLPASLLSQRGTEVVKFFENEKREAEDASKDETLYFVGTYENYKRLREYMDQMAELRT